MQAFVVRYASSNIFVIFLIFSPYVILTKFSGEIIFRYVKLANLEKLIAIIDFPVPGLPYNITFLLLFPDDSLIFVVSRRLFMILSKEGP